MTNTYIFNKYLKLIHKNDKDVCLLNNENSKKIILPKLLYEEIIKSSNNVNPLFEYINSNTLRLLFENNIIIPLKYKHLYRYGLLDTDVAIKGLATSLSTLKFEDYRKWSIIGINTYTNNDLGHSLIQPGTNIIRKCLKLYEHAKDNQYVIDTNRKKVFNSKEVAPFDLGDILIDNKYETIEDLNSKISFILKTLLEFKNTPIFIAGGHDISYYLIKNIINISNEKINIIHFDAHTDKYNSDAQISRGNFMNHVSKLEHVQEVQHIGIREFETSNEFFSFENIITSYELHNSNDISINFTSNELPLYITFDADILDPFFAQEVNYPVIGGPHFYDVLKIFEIICTKYSIIGADFVECFENDKKYNYTASLISNFITLLLNEGKTIYE